MWCVALWVVLNLSLQVYGADDDNNIIRWRVQDKYLNEPRFALPGTGVLINNKKPLYIYLENYSNTSFVTCGYKRTGRFDIWTENAANATLLIEVIDLKLDMSTEWECSTMRNSIVQYFTFKIHIKGKEQVTVEVGRLQLNFTKSDNLEEDFDGIATYWFVDGENVDLACESDIYNKNDGLKRLTYKNAKGTKLFETDEIMSSFPVSFRKIMTVENNNDTIDCTYISVSEINYTYRTIFKVKSETSSANPLQISVNGMKLLSVEGFSKNGELEWKCYHHKLYAGQTINITCDTNKTSRLTPSLNFGDPELDKSLTPVSKNASQVTVTLTMVKGLDRRELFCVMYNGSNYFNAGLRLRLDQNGMYLVLYRTSAITALATVTKYRIGTRKREPIILGLPTTDIIQQYSKDLTTWIIDFSYSVGKTLKLTCIANSDRTFRWTIYQTKDANIPHCNGKDCVITLTEQYNGMSISCADSQVRAVINLHAKQTSSDADDSIGPDGNLTIILAGSVAAIVFTIVSLIICCRIRRNKNTRKRHESSESLTRVLDSPIPTFPRQWTDASESNFDNQERAMKTNSLYETSSTALYSQPIKKSKRTVEPEYQTIEPVYNEPFNIDEDKSKDNNYVNSVRKNSDLNYSNVHDDDRLVTLCSNTYDYATCNGPNAKCTEPLYHEIAVIYK